MRSLDVHYSLGQVQSLLKSLYGPRHYYTTTYADQELSYCGKVPFWMADYLPLVGKGARVLDIGAGYGTLASYSGLLTGAATIAYDRLPLLTHEVCKAMNICRLLGDVEREQLPSYGTGWDAVIMTEVLEHFNFHPLPTLLKIRERLNPTGRIFLSTPDAASWGECNHYTSLSVIPPYDPSYMTYNIPSWLDRHTWQYTEAELQALFKAAGLEVRRWSGSLSPGGRHFNVELERLDVEPKLQ